jgi:hypothetical protein
MSEKQFPGQDEGEHVQFLFRQHPLVMRKALIFGMLAILVGIVPLDFPILYEHPSLLAFFTKVALYMPILVLLVWVYRWIGWYYSVYIVTDRRIVEIKQKGLFNRRVAEWQLDGISNVNYHIGGFQAVLFGYGDITAQAYIGDLVMSKIHNPAEIHEQLMEVVHKAGGGSTRPDN